MVVLLLLLLLLYLFSCLKKINIHPESFGMYKIVEKVRNGFKAKFTKYTIDISSQL